MARKPGDRYQTMQRMIEDLQQLSVAIRFGAAGVPDGITTPFVIPRRKKGRASIAQFISKLFARDTAQKARPAPRLSSQESDSTPVEATLSSARERNIAVLPFRNLTGEPASDFYAKTLADSLITGLAQVPSLNVLPAGAMSRYENQEIDPARIRSELGVDSVLTGNFLKAGNRVRVTAQLIDAASGRIVWSDKLDGDAANAIAIQDRITSQVISGLSEGRVAVDPMQLLKDDNERVRLDAVRTLKFSHDPRALTALVEALEDASLKVKAEAVQAIIHLGEEAAGPVIQLLNDAMDEGDNLTARFAAKALGLIGDRSISPVLIELLRSDDRFVACESALALGRLGETRAVEDLIALLAERNGNIRFAAAEALGEISDPSSADALQQRLSDNDEGVRAKARWALSRIRARSRSQTA
jgi:TolB-like protein